MKVIVASTNPAKIDAVYDGFTRVYPDEVLEIEGISVPSGVRDQPMSDEETLQGALNRATNARAVYKNADYYVGLEGGIELRDNNMMVSAWMVIQSNDGKIGKGRTGAFFLPSKVTALIKDGKELGEADDIVFGKTNSKHTSGSVGILTHELIMRSAYYAEAIVLALIPFTNPNLY